MVYIPHDARWYLAELVEEITVEDTRANIVHRRLMLIRADSPGEGYEKAMELGQESEMVYDNPEGKQVRTKFRGLGELNVIYEELKHGAELLYSEHVGISEENLESWIRPKEDLAVFRTEPPATSVDYGCGEILREAERLIRKSNPERG